MNTADLKQTCLEIMQVSEAVLVTCNGPAGYPYTRATFNLRNGDHFPSLAALFAGHHQDLMALISTNTSSRKVAQLQQDPRANFYYCDPAHTCGVMLLGEVELSQEDALRQSLWCEGWERYYPQGPLDPDYTVLRLFPHLARGWYRGRAFEFGV